MTKLPVANAEITMQPGNYTLHPDKKSVVVELLPADKYTYTITAPGMITVEGIMKVKAGGVRRVNVVFKKRIWHWLLLQMKKLLMQQTLTAK